MSSNISRRDRILGGLWGSLVGDALGVPVEFLNRENVQLNPVTGMRGNGTHHQPKGTWSDDGSMILCTVDSLLNNEFDTQDMGRRFASWMNDGKWTAHGDVFDMGGTTASALTRINLGTAAEQAGGRSEDSNENGSLMRIIPIALRFANEPIEFFSRRIERVSAITHGHERSKIACVLYGLVVRQLLSDQSSEVALSLGRAEFAKHYNHSVELQRFNHHLNDNFGALPEGEIVSTGYVLHTLHAALWCLLTTSNYRECVLKAVNLGGDTDTTGCVAGGLAGVAYGFQSIPGKWVDELARKGDLDCLFQEFADLAPLTSNESV